MRLGFWGLLAMALASALSGCSKDATAKLSFTNATAGSRELERVSPSHYLRDVPRIVARAVPSVFQMKLIAAYVAQDIDPATGSNTGNTAMIYLNNDCQDDIKHCDISGGTAEDGAAMSKIVTSYFDFAGDSATVNAALNAQARSVTPGSYKYARLEFCKYNHEDAKNIKWADGTAVPTSSPQEFQRNNCTVNSAEMSPAIEVAAGGTITITLSYDLSTSITEGDSCTGDDMAGSGTGKRCFSLPTFSPSAS